jgi:hypothetical protein
MNRRLPSKKHLEIIKAAIDRDKDKVVAPCDLKPQDTFCDYGNIRVSKDYRRKNDKGHLALSFLQICILHGGGIYTVFNIFHIDTPPYHHSWFRVGDNDNWWVTGWYVYAHNGSSKARNAFIAESGTVYGARQARRNHKKKLNR